MPRSIFIDRNIRTLIAMHCAPQLSGTTAPVGATGDWSFAPHASQLFPRNTAVSDRTNLDLADSSLGRFDMSSRAKIFTCVTQYINPSSRGRQRITGYLSYIQKVFELRHHDANAPRGICVSSHIHQEITTYSYAISKVGLIHLTKRMAISPCRRSRQVA